VPTVSDFRYLVVPHTHWDREWYLPFEQFRLLLGDVVDGVLEVLERDDSFPTFTLDGQAIVLEDYVDVRPGVQSEHDGGAGRTARRDGDANSSRRGGRARGRPRARAG